VVGTSGTIRSVAEAAHLNAGNEPWRTVNAEVARRKDIRELVRKLMEKDLDERAKVPGVGEQRADAIHLGAALLEQLLELSDKDEITVCDASLREGVILDFLDHHNKGYASATIPDVRRRSVTELARKYERDDPRERHIAELALQIFDGTAERHRLGAVERELLEFAALLHGIGHYIDFKDRHKHSRYVIRHAGLRGFTDEEVEIVAQTVRYHRERSPTRKHKCFRRLARRQQEIVRLLSGMLRIAVALDRGRTQVVKQVRCQLDDGRLDLVIGGAGDLELELWAARGRTLPLERALGTKVQVLLGTEAEALAS
jgi:exopolyphosphatase/guanosine-5'-triphosphate,3'-diphosphate pyrophosphatase